MTASLIKLDSVPGSPKSKQLQEFENIKSVDDATTEDFLVKLAQKEAELIKREAALVAREEAVAAREAALEKLEQASGIPTKVIEVEKSVHHHYYPRTLQATVIRQEPRFVAIENFLDDEEIEELLKYAEPRWRRSVVGRGDSLTDDSQQFQNAQSNNRTSDSCVFLNAETDLVERIEARVACVAGVSIDHVERLNLVRYKHGQYFNEHHDGAHRTKTVFVYLNSIPKVKGGATQFTELNMAIRPVKGMAIMWSNVDENGEADLRMIHTGEPVENTIKYGINCFINKEKCYNKPDKWISEDNYWAPLSDEFNNINCFGEEMTKQERKNKSRLARVDKKREKIKQNLNMAIAVRDQKELEPIVEGEEDQIENDKVDDQEEQTDDLEETEEIEEGKL